MVITISIVLAVFLSTDTPTPEIYTLSLHDALPISHRGGRPDEEGCGGSVARDRGDSIQPARPARRPRLAMDPRHSRRAGMVPDRKSTRLNSSHVRISYAVFCLKKKNTTGWGLCINM